MANTCYDTPMSDEIGFRLNSNDGKRRKRQKLDAIIEYVETEDAEQRLVAAFEMLLSEVVLPADDPAAPIGPQPVTPLLAVDYRTFFRPEAQYFPSRNIAQIW